jgi:hypothetical protein
MDKESQKKLLVDKIRFIMDFLECPWFYCFGKMQAIILSHGQEFDMNYDIDIGVIQDRTDMQKLIDMWTSTGYKLKACLINDITSDPLNMHFVPTEPDMEGTPTIDVFAWIRKGKKLYHTYDVKKEGERIPSEYIFKGVPAKFLEPDKEDIDIIRKKDETLREDGTWEYSLFGQYSGYVARLPYSYGSLLDVWYPGWLFPSRKNMESEAKDRIHCKSCKGLV